jgi:hypothetical protein
MQITADTPRTRFKFKGFDINVPQPFTEGQTLDANLTKFINRQLASVTGNIFASAANRALSKAQDEENAKAKAENRTARTLALSDVMDAAKAQEVFDKIVGDYEPGVVSERGVGEARDPVESIASNIAWERIKARLKANNIKVNSVKAEKKADLIKQLLARDPSIMEQAKAAVGDNAPSDGLDDLFSDLGGDTQADTNTDSTGADPALDANVSTDEGAAAAADAEDAPAPGEGNPETPTDEGGAFA